MHNFKITKTYLHDSVQWLRIREKMKSLEFVNKRRHAVKHNFVNTGLLTILIVTGNERCVHTLRRTYLYVSNEKFYFKFILPL